MPLKPRVLRKLAVSILSLATVTLLVTSCQKTNSGNLRDANFVSPNLARAMGSKISMSMLQGDARLASKTTSMDSEIYATHVVDNIYTLNDKNDDPALYICTYGPNNGFSVISADLRYAPICAIVPEGTYNPNDSLPIPSMLYSWFGRTIESIEMLRDSIAVDTGYAAFQWCDALQQTNLMSTLSSQGMSIDSATLESRSNVFGYSYSGQWVGAWPAPPDCGATRINTVDLRMQTQWGQGCYYNDLCGTCSDPTACYREAAGCVAVAMAQVIRHVNNGCPKKPYNFAIMPNRLLFSSSPAAKLETARLIHDCGAEIFTNYDCGLSLAQSNDACTALKYNHCMFNAKYSSYNQNVVASNIRNHGAPVILDGCSEQHIHGWGPFKWYTYDQCHAWVCSGFKEIKNDCGGMLTMFKMNWGWDHEALGPMWNGWYSVYTPYMVGAGNFNFQYANMMIYDLY